MPALWWPVSPRKKRPVTEDTKVAQYEAQVKTREAKCLERLALKAALSKASIIATSQDVKVATGPDNQRSTSLGDS